MKNNVHAPGRESPHAADQVDHEFAFDITLDAAVRVRAKSQAEAEALLLKLLDAASCNAGAWPDGSPILFEASVNDHPLCLHEVDGEEVGTEPEDKNVNQQRIGG